MNQAFEPEKVFQRAEKAKLASRVRISDRLGSCLIGKNSGPGWIYSSCGDAWILTKEALKHFGFFPSRN